MISNAASKILIAILILAFPVILPILKEYIEVKTRARNSKSQNNKNVFSEVAIYAMEVESRGQKVSYSIIAIFAILILYFAIKLVFPSLDNDIITLVISSFFAIVVMDSNSHSHSVTSDTEDWKKVYIQEKAIRIKYKDSFSAIDSADKGQSFDKSALSANLFYEYINELTGNENWLLDEVKYSLIKNELLAKSEICLHSVWSVNVAKELSKMLKEDVSYMDKWWQIIKDQKASQKVLNEEQIRISHTHTP